MHLLLTFQEVMPINGNSQPVSHANHILTASESHFKIRESMGLLYPCQPFVREGEGVPEGSVGGKAT